MNDALLQIQSVRQAFPKPDGEDMLVLDDINFSLADGQIVGLLGRSGSGKSTTLRLIAGLAPPTAGSILYHGQPVVGPAPGIAMVFQTFALFPWLTVLENVQLGLEALGLPEAQIRQRALAGIDLIGLDGYESAYPRELSGGMRQRVGFARALVVHPNILLMDEPFSALDVQTRNLMEGELLALWQGSGKTVIFVTHDLEEAIALADEVVVMTAGPGRVKARYDVPLPRPRDVESARLDPRFTTLYAAMWSDLRDEVLESYARANAAG